ncbi:MAG: efflux RND transporter periplasmic adaptor subunit [Planctomycetes bacterium]|nr:efflux RND transporter periplasmic adaptor subunit [Planctomycetota bacterium]
MEKVIPRRVDRSPQPLHQRLDRPAPAPITAAPVATATRPTTPLSKNPATDAPNANGLLALLADVQAADDFESAVQQLCSRLTDWSGATRGVLGVSNAHGTVKVSAISDATNLDQRSELMLAFEATLDEALAKQELASWTSASSDNAPIFRRLTRLASTDAVIGIPLRKKNGDPVGALLLCGDIAWHAQLLRSTALEICQTPIASSLDLLRNTREGRWTKFRAALKTRIGQLRSRLAIATSILVASILLFPTPFKVKCDFTVEPVTRRFVATPFDGTLDKTFVEPGNIVQMGQVLAVMDERELQLQLAGYEAEYGAAKKKRMAALATREAATAQLAALECAQLETKLETINERLKHLSIKCPMDGVVVSGDLRRTEGAPLSVGQSLFEIAPLDRMIAEIAVPQEEVSHVRRGMSVDLRFEAFPGQSWSGELVKVHPRAELRDQSTVFIAEVHLENPDNRLSPGMSGRAKIQSKRRSVGWILFHRSANALAQRMGW